MECLVGRRIQILKYEPIKKAARDIFNVTVINQMHMHAGAHVDVPLHSVQEGKTVEQYPIDRYIGEGVVLDFRRKRPAEEITEEDIRIYEDSISDEDVVMLCTDWSKKRGYNSDYLYKWPYLGVPACNFLAERKVKVCWNRRFEHSWVDGKCSSSGTCHESVLCRYT